MTKRSLILTAACGTVLLSSCSQSAGPNEVAAKEPVTATAPAVPAPPAEPAMRPVTIPAGTMVSVRTLSAVSTRDSRSGETVRATLEAPLTVGGAILAPRGADVTLLVADSDQGGRVKGRAVVGLRLTSLQLAGTNRDVVSNTFWQEAPGTKKKDAAKVGVLTGIGAAIGAIADGGRGAAIGAASGAGAGSAVVLSTRGDAAVIPAESVVQFHLQQPVTVNVKS